MKKLILTVLLFLLVASSTGCTILNDSQSSIENDDKLIINQTSTKKYFGCSDTSLEDQRC
jgi:uncharacterized protein YcfL